MTTATKLVPDAEILPGYRLIRKIGSGGYGEVWLCDAPGGLKKAVKVIYGTMDEDRASSELRSLNRIREVKHPFILSLERIEIVDGQLIIVTELAESSLYDQFQAYCHQGFDGIPRAKLLGYVRDTAEALDYLSLKHDLQHLDVKPGNLLLIAERVKLADFGVVKNLSEKMVSCVGGLTPSYAAPEMFDGRAGRHSDQYSLAIMYYELLTGKLPFDGTTMAQLASQHLHHKPDIELATPAEQEVLARALSKDPSRRFPSCSEFIEHLANTKEAPPPAAKTATASTFPANSTVTPRSFATKRKPVTRNVKEKLTPKASTILVAKKPIVELPQLSDYIAGGWHQSPCLFIGLGGVGCQVLAKLREVFLDSDAPTDHTHWLLVDSAADGLKVGQDNQSIAFDDREKLLLPLRDAHYYREAKPERFEMVSRRWLYNIPRNMMTGGARPLGQVALLDQQQAIADALSEAIESLLHYQQSNAHETDSHTFVPRIYLVTSAHGGTGSAWFCDMGFAIRNILDEHCSGNYRLIGLISSAPSSNESRELLPSAAATSFLTELCHYFKSNNEYFGLTDKPFYASPESIDERKPPVDQVYWFTGERLLSKDSTNESIRRMAQMLIVDSSTNVGTLLDKGRSNVTDSEKTDSKHWLRSISFESCDIEYQKRLSDIVQACMVEYCRKWFPMVSRNDMSTTVRSTMAEKGSSRTTNPILESEEYLGELAEHLQQLLSDMRMSGDAWLHHCSQVIRSRYPNSHNPFEEPIEPIVDEIFATMLAQCSNRSRLSPIPCKLHAGLLTGLQIQATKMEETLRLAKSRHEHDLDAFKLLANSQATSGKLDTKQELTATQIEDASRKMRLAILRYDIAIRMLEMLIKRLEEPIQLIRRRLTKLSRVWSSLPSLMPDNLDLSDLKKSMSDVLSMKLTPLVDSIRYEVHSLLRKLSTFYVLGHEEMNHLPGSIQDSDIAKLCDAEPELPFHPSKLLFALENLLKRNHPLLADGEFEEMWLQHQTGLKIRQTLSNVEQKFESAAGGRRMILAASLSESSLLSRGNWREQMQLPVSIVSVPVEKQILGIELQDIDPAVICHRFWGNSPDLMSLVERMHARTDVKWDPLFPSPEKSTDSSEENEEASEP